MTLVRGTILGCVFLGEERRKEALAAFTEASAIDPHYPLLQDKIVTALLGLGHYIKALQICENLVGARPQDATAWATLALSASYCRKWDRSLTAAQRAFKLNPINPQILFRYSIISGEWGRLKRQRLLLERAILLDPQDPHFRRFLGILPPRPELETRLPLISNEHWVKAVAPGSLPYTKAAATLREMYWRILSMQPRTGSTQKKYASDNNRSFDDQSFTRVLVLFSTQRRRVL